MLKQTVRKKPKLVVILGPTASGKTGLAIELAKKLKTEIISGDSQLVYRGFDIGSAKPDETEMSGITHHLIDVLPPTASFNVADFVQRATGLINEINQRGKIPILAGGTGLYIQSLIEGYRFNKTSGDEEYRNYLEQLAENKGRQFVHDMLKAINPEAADRIHVNNFRRVIRALEVYHLGGEQISAEKEVDFVYDVYVAGLYWNRSLLYDRINQRVDIMLESGLENEVCGLLKSGVPADCQAMRGIGYKELLNYLNGLCTLDKAVDDIKKGTRHFAKRQLTWYRRMEYIHWYQPSLYGNVSALCNNIYRDLMNYYK